jgi:hypothetical protein
MVGIGDAICEHAIQKLNKFNIPKSNTKTLMKKHP